MKTRKVDMELASGVCPSLSLGTAPAAFASAIQFFAAAQCLITEDWPSSAELNDWEEFDFIIIGAGSAGSVLANRLSEVAKWKILLIEAGDDPPAESIIPVLSGSLYGTAHDWQYETESLGKTNNANKNQTVLWPRGKMLGGSSSINAMIYFRGNDHDYNEWYNQGNKEWHPSVVRKYFNKAENLQDEHLLKEPKIGEFYGQRGPLVINSFNSSKKIVANDVLKSWDEIGIKNVPDLNVANVMGSGNFRGTASNGHRNSAATAYLIPIQDRKNLRIVKNTIATRVIIDSIRNLAVGVEVYSQSENITRIIFATREVIISAGAINTPQLLMLSGIGPREHLESVNVTCLLDSPAVGQNLQDHLVIPIPIFGNETRFPKTADRAFDTVRYLYDRTGYLAQSSADDISAFYALNKNATFPLFQNHFAAMPAKSSAVETVFSTTHNYKDSVVKSITELSRNYALFYFIFNLLHPHSRGHIALRTNNPLDKPLIYPNYFGDRRDLEESVAGIKRLTKILDTTYFRSIGAFLGRMKWYECDNFALNSDEYWECICVNMVVTIYHPVGTAKMGVNRETSVVDSRLKVHGVKGLRVVDASVMPTITSGNTNGPVIMIGERAADLIKQDYKVKVEQ